jgi:hypothetical protein
LAALAARYADYVNIILPLGKLGRMSAEGFQLLNDEALRERVSYVRAEVKRLGRDPGAIKIATSFRYLWWWRLRKRRVRLWRL